MKVKLLRGGAVLRRPLASFREGLYPELLDKAQADGYLAGQHTAWCCPARYGDAVVDAR